MDEYRSPVEHVADADETREEQRFMVSVAGSNDGDKGRLTGNPAPTVEEALDAVNWGAFN